MPVHGRVSPFVVALLAVVVAAGGAMGIFALRQEPPSARVPTSSESPSLQHTSPAGPSPSEGDLQVASGPIRVKVVRVVDIKDPLAMGFSPRDEGIFVASRRGGIYRVEKGTATVVLDLSSRTTCCEGHNGVLGLTFSPDGSKMYVSFTDKRGALHVTEFASPDERLAATSGRDLLVVPWPSISNHGGGLVFGPDGYLYISMGDGSHGIESNNPAQSLDSLLGKLLRIDPQPSGGRPYGIPPSNPFVGRNKARPEIYAYGLRQPWRFSFDRATGDLWLADVGLYSVEEVNFLRAGTGAGSNFGWDRVEGSRRLTGDPPRDHVPPIIEYTHSAGRCAVIGGYVYRGSLIPALQGAYLFGDNCDGRIRAFVQQQGEPKQRLIPNIELNGLASFGEDADGEIYVLSVFRGVFALRPVEDQS